ncbi:MAG: UvrD-helicase domain-containing protein [Holosporales bacterium]|nr:UvrD-helicase domain-containing protein [Holosporales bacterium]
MNSSEQAQLDALDLSSSCFIFASAGSGKTSTLVKRYVKSVFYGLHPKEILCLTFTNAAVLEMKARISKILEALYLNENGFTERYVAEHLGVSNVSQKETVTAESVFFTFQDNFSNVKIVTIHSFCQKLLQQFPLEAGIPPNFKIADECDAEIILQQAKKNAIAKLAESKDLWIALSGLMSTYSFDELVEKIYELSANFNEFFDVYPDLNVYRAMLEEMFPVDKPVEFSDAQAMFMANEGLSQSEQESEFLTSAGTTRKKMRFSDKTMAYSIAEVMFANSQRLKKAAFIEKNCRFLEAVKVILDEYRYLKDTANVIDFTDVLYKAKYLTTKSCAKEFVLSSVCAGIKSIMVDEAQDLSAIQWELISFFANDMFYDASSDKTITAVGDIKQSIYRFQGARHEMFSNFYEHCKLSFAKFGKPLRTVYLNSNYRTVPEILEKVDQVFEYINSKFSLDQDLIPYQKHVAFRPPAVAHGKSFEMVDVSDTEDKAQRIAEHIYGRISDDHNDVLILTRSRLPLVNDVVSELSRRGIHVVASDKVLLKEHLLIMDLLAVADICVDNTNDYAVACILKSPYFFDSPLTDSDLYDICHGRMTFVLERLRIMNREKCTFLMDIVDSCKPDDPLEFFYRVTIRLKNLSGRDYEILSAFMDEVLHFADTFSGTIKEFLSYFRSRNKETTDIIAASDTIRLSTIHGAKGLEADSVFLLDFNIEADKSKMKMVFTNTTGRRKLCFIRPSQRESFEEMEDIMETECIEERNELIRLLYVAMTRARNSFCIFGTDNQKSAYSLIKQAT